MASSTIQTYSPDKYKSLSAVEEVSDEFEQSKGDEALKAIGAIIKRYGLEALWAVQLLHNHFELDDSERLVSFGTVSVPIKIDTVSPERASQIKPVSWILSPEGVFPYEYALLSPNDAPDEFAIEILFAKMSETFSELGVSHLLGLVYLPGTALGSEYTEGRANITLPAGILLGNEAEDYIDVLWTFKNTDPENNGRCARQCKRDTILRKHKRVHRHVDVAGDKVVRSTKKPAEETF